MPASRVIVALDFADERSAMELVDRINPELCRLKIGKELFTRSGPQLVRKLVALGYDVFLDLKYHDIPNTVANACKAAADLGVWMLNVHALGGPVMMAAARAALSDDDSPMLIAVTVLTSSSEDDLQAVGINHSAQQMVERLARLNVRRLQNADDLRALITAVCHEPDFVAPMTDRLATGFTLGLGRLTHIATPSKQANHFSGNTGFLSIAGSLSRSTSAR